MPFTIDEEPLPLPISWPDYRVNPLSKREGRVHAVLAEVEESDARMLFASLFDYFGLKEFSVPLPPSGLPGEPELHYDEDTKRVIGLGIAYLRALAEDQPRRRLNLWKEAERILAEMKRRGLKEFLDQPDIEIRQITSKSKHK